MGFNHKYNYNTSVIRAMIVGLLGVMNERLYYEQQKSDTESEIVRIAFFYSEGGDERALQDAYVKGGWSDCTPDFIEGNYDYIPRGMIQYTGITILSSELTSRYVRGFYTKEEEGKLNRYNSTINSIPIQLNFNAEIVYDTSIESFCIIESAMRELFKTVTFMVQYKGFSIPCVAGFPELYDNQKLFEYTYQGNDIRPKISFPVELHGYMPIPDTKSEMHASKQILHTQQNVSLLSPTGPTGPTDNQLNYMNSPTGPTGNFNTTTEWA